MSNSRACASCATANVSLQQCARCRSVSYCNRDCQKTHWSTHKQSCTRTGQGSKQPSSRTSSSAQASETFSAGDQDSKPFLAISKDLYFHDRSVEKTFQLLIDCLRMRQEDEYTLGGRLMNGSVYGCDDEDASSEPAFRTFIDKAQAIPGFLPSWWTETSVDDCIQYARAAGSLLKCAQESHDIREKWGDDSMPMQLRLVAERVYEQTAGIGCDTMIELMMIQQGCYGEYAAHLRQVRGE
jgi:splicing suppressor protein 51